MGQQSTVDLSRLELMPISIENIWPPFSEQSTQAPESSIFELYTKGPDLPDHGHSPARPEIPKQMLHEVKICEIPKAHPHPNIAAYMGCVVTAG